MMPTKMLLAICLLLLNSVWAMADNRPGTGATRGKARPGVFDYYLVSLSWSPNYCLSHPEDRAQCAGKGYGFVLHGLWPQYTRGGYPQMCRVAHSLTPEAKKFASTIFPSPKLAQHEWSKHGTCSGLDALGYFQLSSRAYTNITIPEALSAPKKPLAWSVKQITTAFTAANPQLSGNSLAVICHGQDLSEVRVCMDKDLTPTACGKGVAHQCRPGSVRVRPIR